jgi:hypothetical protein
MNTLLESKCDARQEEEGADEGIRWQEKGFSSLKEIKVILLFL